MLKSTLDVIMKTASHVTKHMLRSVGILDVIEATTDAERALAHSGVLKPCSKLATHKAAHSAVHALRAEPSSLSSRAGVSRPRNAYARWVEGPQARALADQQLCQASKTRISPIVSGTTVHKR